MTTNGSLVEAVKKASSGREVVPNLVHVRQMFLFHDSSWEEGRLVVLCDKGNVFEQRRGEFTLVGNINDSYIMEETAWYNNRT